MPTTQVVLFTRDLRVHDNPALADACATAETVVPLFVLDPRAPTSANRRRFLAECLADLRDSLRVRGGDLVIRQGDPVAESIAVVRSVGAAGVCLAADASAYARRRQQRLADATATHRLSLRLFDGVTVVPPGALRPAGGDHYRVFTPYWRAWLAHERRTAVGAPVRLALPAGIHTGSLPAPGRGASPAAMPGGESAARSRRAAWRRQLPGYPDRRDDLAGDATSRLSPYLHFGCVSPLEVAEDAAEWEPYLRQLCWRDFHHQVLHAFPALGSRDYRPGRRVAEWRHDPELLAAWQTGHTGVPIVDAGMRQLRAEGFMHNRARLITAAFLTRHLGLDWRDGASWFAHWLLDADVASNSGNWQWVAGTGNDTRPHRRFNPVRQARRFDPEGEYVRRWVPELAGIAGPAVHEPWRLPASARHRDYRSAPPPVHRPG